MRTILALLLFAGLAVGQTKVRTENFPQTLIDAVTLADSLLKRIAELESRLAALEASRSAVRVTGARLSVDTADTTGRTWVFPASNPPKDIHQAAIYLAVRLTEGVDYEVLAGNRIRLAEYFGDGLAGSIVIADYELAARSGP